ncbi:hypothetical protein [Ferruginibacter albus]|uniref:hypothetical protein n=1 Tax=Ferruginibacter albus TaxID=2875540 RepID=UPI001CC5AE31|nr:hypothetical protein [Ferruginibacter albus]UAY52525.1 hypothetical protein K9M53_02265 [Ferruginibacter albus]
MAELDENIQRINQKLQQLLKQYQLLQKENERKTAEIASLKENKTTQENKITELQQQVMILKSAAGEMSEADKKQFERNINQYVKQIDKCIALLSE